MHICAYIHWYYKYTKIHTCTCVNWYKAFKGLPNLKIVGTWDDHDLGVDGANKNYKYLKESKEIFLNFIGEEKGSKRYSSEHHGVYDVVNMKFANNTVAIFLLDTRWIYMYVHVYKALGENRLFIHII